MELLLLYVATTLLAVAFFRIGRLCGDCLPNVSGFLCGVALTVGSLLCWFSSGGLVWASWFTPQVAYAASNFPALIVVIAAGILSAQTAIRAGRRGVLCSGLCIAVASLFAGMQLRPILRPLELAKSSQWKDGVCLQTHESSCVPAAAVNLLHAHGVDTDERMAAQWARTSRDGTPPIGSFLAVSRGLAGSEFEARVESSQASLPNVQHLPMLAHVCFVEDPETKSIASNIYNELLCGIRSRNQGHAVVILNHSSKGWLVADPASGLSVWSDGYLRKYWSGEGVYIANRDLP